MEGRQEIEAGCRAATVAQLEQQWCQTKDPSNLLRRAGSDNSQHQLLEKVGNDLQRWQIGICFASSRFPSKSWGFCLNSLSAPTHVLAELFVHSVQEALEVENKDLHLYYDSAVLQTFKLIQ